MSYTAIVKYNAGNIRSVELALERLGKTAVVTDDEAQLRNADRVIFPGVGEASSAMNYLQQKGLDILLPTLTQPVLGICLGMQLLCSHSEEGDTKCLGVFDHEVKKFTGAQKIPHMGWNTVNQLKEPLFTGIEEETFMYFVHSFYADLGKQSAAVTEYIIPFSAALQKNNFYGVQFHPEKSGLAGEQLLKNFLSL
jgi:imidazole glycerol-phosphate synthase subunit HisH